MSDPCIDASQADTKARGPEESVGEDQEAKPAIKHSAIIFASVMSRAKDLYLYIRAGQIAL